MTTATEVRTILGREHFASEGFRAKLVSAMAMISVTVVETKAAKPYVAFSGGKDSMAVLALVERTIGEVVAHWSDDELEYPETVAMMTRLCDDPNFVVSRGWTQHAGWFWPWRDRPFWREPLPGTLSAGMDSDDWMARRGHDLTFLGTRASESAKRRDWLRTARALHGAWYPVKSGTGRRCCPLWDWTEDDIWALVAGWNLPVNPVYNRLEEIGVLRKRQRVGPLCLARREDLAAGWPDLLERLEARYGRRWS